MVYPALLPLMRTLRLPVVDWTDAPADLNGLIRFAERRNLVSARVPSRFKRSLPQFDSRSYSPFSSLGEVGSHFTATVSGRGKTRHYWHRFKIIEEPTCPRGKGNQTTNHIIYACEKLTNGRDRLTKTVVRTNKWPINKRDLIRRHYKDPLCVCAIW